MMQDAIDSSTRVVISLSDPQKWKFRQGDDSRSKWMDVYSIPGNVHMDLLRNEIIKDPFIGQLEKECQWVGETPWFYQGRFETPGRMHGAKAVLAFDGLDTYATIWLNGHEILKTQDMFIPERIEVTDLLSYSGEDNVLEIKFDSTYLIGKKLVEHDPDHRWGCWNGDISRLAVRKAQFHYGWDWGPTLLTCGIWRPISLEIYKSRVSDLHCTTSIDKSLGFAEVLVKAETEGPADQVSFEISVGGDIVSSETVSIENNVASATFITLKPRLWYPHTYGEQPLYKVKATLSQNGLVLDAINKRFGLRRAQIVQRKLEGATGTSFFCEINNIPIFCGGSNWIPCDSFTTRIGPKRYHDWVRMIAEGNQTMLRVWGGGSFEEQAFYDSCDEMGVLIWQDFLFACGNYPANKEFLSLIEREARANVKLLRHHPSIVIWAGNNEDYQYRETERLDYDPKDTDPKSWLESTFPARYIYEKILVDVTSELVPETYYHFGSPYGGKDTTDPTVGDIHQWNVWHGTQEKYQNFDRLIGRFVSEFGMEAFPDMKTVDKYFIRGNQDVDYFPQSSTSDFHNKAVGQERRLALYLAENIRYTFKPFEQYVYCTQLMQAECLSTAYRLWKRQWKGPGREYCSGALVWQADDCWPSTSWSIIDYYLRPKMAYYAIKRELRPITVGLKRTVQEVPADKYTRAHVKKVHKIEVWACNLSLETRKMSFSFNTFNLTTGRKCIHDDLTSIKLSSNRSTEIIDFEIPSPVGHDDHGTKTLDIVKSSDEEAQQTTVAAYLHDHNGKQVARAVNWPEPLRYVHLPKPKTIDLKLISDDGDDGKSHGIGSKRQDKSSSEAVELLVSADVPVKGLMVEVIGSGNQDSQVSFNDNSIDLVPGETISVGVKGLKCGDEDRLKVKYLGMS